MRAPGVEYSSTPMTDRLAHTTVLPHRVRSPFVAIEYGHLRVEDHCLLVERETEEIEIPVAMVSAILLEPGVTVTHEAVKLAAEHGVLLIWVGEAGVRVYSAGNPGGKAPERLIRQVRIHTDQNLRMAAAMRLYRLMFGEAFKETRSLEKLRGLEGAKVKVLYQNIAAQYGVTWAGRDKAAKALRDALGFATSCLYGLSEAVILAAGYAPAIGIVHCGNERSLAFDLADTMKFKTVVPAAFEVYAASPVDTANRVRHRCRDLFREQKLAERLFANLFEIIGDVTDAGIE